MIFHRKAKGTDDCAGIPSKAHSTKITALISLFLWSKWVGSTKPFACKEEVTWEGPGAFPTGLRARARGHLSSLGLTSGAEREAKGGWSHSVNCTGTPGSSPQGGRAELTAWPTDSPHPSPLQFSPSLCIPLSPHGAEPRI